MWLYTFVEFSCTRDAYLLENIEDVRERTVAMVYRGEHADRGLLQIKRIQSKMNSKSVPGKRRFISELRLIGITQVPSDIDRDLLTFFEVAEIDNSSTTTDAV